MGNHFVLIHGAWHGPWCWKGVIKALEKAGHTAEAPTMPGHRRDDDRSNINFDDYVNKITTTLNRQASPVVLVGHSSAGFLLQVSAPKVPDKIAQLIFLNAFVLADGNCQLDLVPPEAAEGMVTAAKASPDNCVPVMEDFVRQQLMGGESTAMQDSLMGQLVPQPLALFTTPVSTKDFEDLTLPISVVFCKDDVSLPPGAYLGMAQELGDFNLIEVDGSHEALFTRPGIIADALIQTLK